MGGSIRNTQPRGSDCGEQIDRRILLPVFPPEQLHSDQGRQFESELLQEVCKLLGISKSRITPYHPQSDGLVER